MTLEESYAEKGLAITQIELWQQRLKKANDVIIQELNKSMTPKLVEEAKSDSNGSAS